MTMHGYGSFAKYYDQLTQNISYGERAAYFDAIIKQNMDSASVVADLACGTGSLSFELADLGYDVVGVELSEDMLSVAMQKKMERPDLRLPIRCLSARISVSWNCTARWMRQSAHWTASITSQNRKVSGRCSGRSGSMYARTDCSCLM